MIFEELKYVYNGTADYEKDKRFYMEHLGATLVWEFSRFGTQVCALKLGNLNHQILMAGHLRADQQINIYRTGDLQKALQQLKKRGLVFSSGKFGIPDGNCILFKDFSGKESGIYEQTKPDSFLKEEYLRQQTAQE